MQRSTCTVEQNWINLPKETELDAQQMQICVGARFINILRHLSMQIGAQLDLQVSWIPIAYWLSMGV